MHFNHYPLNNKGSTRKILSRDFLLYITFRDNEWWRRGELNPCPKIHPYIFLRAQFTVFALRQFPFQAHRQTGTPGR